MESAAPPGHCLWVTWDYRGVMTSEHMPTLLIGLVALVLLLFCLTPRAAVSGSPSPPPSPWIDLPCEMTRGGAPEHQVVLSLRSPSKRSVSVLLGAGEPGSQIVGRDGEAFVIEPGYTCGLDYLHDCWHTTTVTIPGGKKHSTIIFPLVFDSQGLGLKQALDEAFARGPVACVYRAMRATCSPGPNWQQQPPPEKGPYMPEDFEGKSVRQLAKTYGDPTCSADGVSQWKLPTGCTDRRWTVTVWFERRAARTVHIESFSTGELCF